MLEHDNMIIRDTNTLPNSITLVTICNYEKYQENITQNNNAINSATTNTEYKNKRRNEEIFDFSIVDEAYIPAIKTWLDYKKGRRESYKNQKSFVQLYKKMLKIGSPDEVMSAVENSMANNYAGLFPEKSCDKQKEEKIKDATDIIKELITQRGDTNTQDIWDRDRLFK